MTTLRWARYIRVSTVEQALPGTASIATQDKETLALVQREGGVLVDTYTDASRYYVGRRQVEPSGERADRPEWLRMLGDLRTGRVNAVVVYHSSRLYRNYRPAIDFLELVEERGVTVRSVTDGFDPRFAMLQAWAAREENKVRANRSVMGRQNKARLGLAPTRHSLFYRTLRDDNGRRIGSEFVADYRAFFDEAARLFLEGTAYVRIAYLLRTNPATGGPLSANTVQRLFQNPWYRGQVDYGRGARYAATPRFVAPGQHAPAWDAATVRAIEAELARREAVGYSQAHAYGRPGTAAGLFSGFVRCGLCGRLMATQYRERSRPLIYYTCHSVWKARKGLAHGPGLPHANNSISQARLVPLVDDLIRALAAPGAAEAAAASLGTPRQAVPPPDALLGKLEKHRAQLDRLPADQDEARAYLAQLVEREQAEYAAALAEYESAAAPTVDLAALQAACRDLAAAGSLAAADAAEARRMLLALGAVYVKDKALAAPPVFDNN